MYESTESCFVQKFNILSFFEFYSLEFFSYLCCRIQQDEMKTLLVIILIIHRIFVFMLSLRTGYG